MTFTLKEMFNEYCGNDWVRSDPGKSLEDMHNILECYNGLRYFSAENLLRELIWKVGVVMGTAFYKASMYKDPDNGWIFQHPRDKDVERMARRMVYPTGGIVMTTSPLAARYFVTRIGWNRKNRDVRSVWNDVLNLAVLEDNTVTIPTSRYKAEVFHLKDLDLEIDTKDYYISGYHILGLRKEAMD